MASTYAVLTGPHGSTCKSATGCTGVRAHVVTRGRSPITARLRLQVKEHPGGCPASAPSSDDATPTCNLRRENLRWGGVTGGGGGALDFRYGSAHPVCEIGGPRPRGTPVRRVIVMRINFYPLRNRPKQQPLSPPTRTEQSSHDNDRPAVLGEG